jgi:hypothetical protein
MLTPAMGTNLHDKEAQTRPCHRACPGGWGKASSVLGNSRHLNKTSPSTHSHGIMAHLPDRPL